MITGVCGVQRLVSDSGLYRSKGKMAIVVEWRQRVLLPYFQSLMGQRFEFPLSLSRQLRQQLGFSQEDRVQGGNANSKGLAGYTVT